MKETHPKSKLGVHRYDTKGAEDMGKDMDSMNVLLRDSRDGGGLEGKEKG
jgi:hypothetical protein